MKALQYLSIITAAAFCVYLMTFGPLGWIFAGFFLVLVYAGGVWIGHALEIRRHRRQVDNIYVWSASPDDRTVLRRARHHSKYLRLAGNYVDEKGKKHGNGVQVVPIIFQDSMSGKYTEAPAETWEEFQDRKDLIMRKDRIARRLAIDTGDPEMRRYYERVVLRQID